MARKPILLNTRTFSSHLFFGPYIYLPLICAFVWLAELLALMALWVSSGKPQYERGEANPVFISDVGGTYHTLFIIMSSVTVAFYIASLFAERWLRHVDRLPTDLRTREKVFDWLAIIFCIIGSAGLVLLSVFDTFHHSTLHWSFTLVFIVGVALSAIFQSAEIWSLHKDHPDRKSLLRNSIYKLVIVTIAIACAIAFGATYGTCGGEVFATSKHTAEECQKITAAAGALEWTVAFILFFYFLTLVADLWPAGKSSPRYMRRLARWQEKHGEGDDFTGRRAFDMYPERWETGAQMREEQLRRDMIARNTGAQTLDLAGPPMSQTTTPRMSEANPRMSENSQAPLNAANGNGNYLVTVPNGGNNSYTVRQA